MLKAIETRYKGYRFRSRTEARWAVFYDALGIAYEYEKEGFNIDGTLYLPDFYIPHLDAFIEIKGAKPEDENAEKAKHLAEVSKKKVHLFYGSVWMPSETSGGITYGHYMGIESRVTEWTECPVCHRVAPAGHRMAFEIGCGCLPMEVSVYDVQKNEKTGMYDEVISTGILILPPSERIINAYIKARESRFEHGETPK